MKPTDGLGLFHVSKGETMSEEAAERVMDGRVWAEFCDALKSAGDVVLREGSPRDAFDRAEGFRYLSRLARVALESYVEFADPAAPVLRRPSHAPRWRWRPRRRVARPARRHVRSAARCPAGRRWCSSRSTPPVAARRSTWRAPRARRSPCIRRTTRMEHRGEDAHQMRLTPTGWPAQERVLAVKHAEHALLLVPL